MGESKRSSAANTVGQNLTDLNNGISSQTFQVGNRFDKFKPQFGYSDQKANIDDLFNQNTSLINTSFNNAAAKAGNNTISRLASQGITSGSILNDAVDKSTNELNSGKFDALTKLGIAKAGQTGDLMTKTNEDQFRTTQAAQGIDVQNILNTLQKYGLLSNNAGQQMANLQNYDDSTWGDIIGKIIAAGARVGAAAV